MSVLDIDENFRVPIGVTSIDISAIPEFDETRCGLLPSIRQKLSRMDSVFLDSETGLKIIAEEIRHIVTKYFIFKELEGDVSVNIMRHALRPTDFRVYQSVNDGITYAPPYNIISIIISKLKTIKS